MKSTSYYLCTVYPCVYREHTNINNNLESRSGLSLCIQGTPSIAGYRLYACRFIPVYTGNTRAPHMVSAIAAVYPCVYREHELIVGTSKQYDTVYPCVYREHGFKSADNLASFGLSLCVQGTRGGHRKNGSPTRFIPVCTGNTSSISLASVGKSVYPCVYREHCRRHAKF